MCGLAGAVCRAGIGEETLVAMGEAVSARGPDGAGTFRSPLFDAAGDAWQCGLAHRRLAVFDPSPAGAQPMTSRSGRLHIAFNGEIYNHLELRRRLPGFAWRTGTDTEVLLELFEVHGPRILPWLNGMFAFALYDAGSGRLWLARDRLGVKPLFYRADREGIVFGSELSAILAGPRFPREIDPDALSAYLDFGFVPAPRTLLRGVSKLEPGSVLCWRDGGAEIREWWEPPASRPEADAGWRERLYATLSDAVSLCLR